MPELGGGCLARSRRATSNCGLSVRPESSRWSWQLACELAAYGTQYCRDWRRPQCVRTTGLGKSTRSLSRPPVYNDALEQIVKKNLELIALDREFNRIGS